MTKISPKKVPKKDRELDLGTGNVCGFTLHTPYFSEASNKLLPTIELDYVDVGQSFAVLDICLSNVDVCCGG